jgi:hypothetical protein
MTDLTSVIADLRAFEASARKLSAEVVPLLRRGNTVIARGYENMNDAAFPAEVLAPLHRAGNMLGEVISIAGRATFDLIAALAQHPELDPLPAPPDVESVADDEIEERPAKVARRR